MRKRSARHGCRRLRPVPTIETANRESTVTARVPGSSFNPILKPESSTEATDNGVRRTPDLANRMNTSWVKLFNGKDLTGWKPHPTQQGQWHVKNGVLIGSGGEISHLYTERDDYLNFHLKAEVRFSEEQAGRSSFARDSGPRFRRTHAISQGFSRHDQQLTSFPAEHGGSLQRPDSRARVDRPCQRTTAAARRMVHNGLFDDRRKL